MTPWRVNQFIFNRCQWKLTISCTASDPFDLASRALMTVDRVHAINGIRVFTGLKDDLMNYLRSFAGEIFIPGF
jgi:hypothetical protein